MHNDYITKLFNKIYVHNKHQLLWYQIKFKYLCSITCSFPRLWENILQFHCYFKRLEEEITKTKKTSFVQLRERNTIPINKLYRDLHQSYRLCFNSVLGCALNYICFQYISYFHNVKFFNVKLKFHQFRTKFFVNERVLIE